MGENCYTCKHNRNNYKDNHCNCEFEALPQKDEDICENYEEAE